MESNTSNKKKTDIKKEIEAGKLHKNDFLHLPSFFKKKNS